MSSGDSWAYKNRVLLLCKRNLTMISRYHEAELQELGSIDRKRFLEPEERKNTADARLLKMSLNCDSINNTNIFDNFGERNTRVERRGSTLITNAGHERSWSSDNSKLTSPILNECYTRGVTETNIVQGHCSWNNFWTVRNFAFCSLFLINVCYQFT